MDGMLGGDAMCRMGTSDMFIVACGGDAARCRDARPPVAAAAVAAAAVEPYVLSPKKPVAANTRASCSSCRYTSRIKYRAGAVLLKTEDSGGGPPSGPSGIHESG